MKRKLLSALLTLSLVLSLLPLPLSLAAVEGDLRYEFKDGEITITGLDGDQPAALTIPSEIRGYPVTRIGDNAFNGCTKIKEINLPSSLVSIGNSGLNNTGVTELVIPEGVTTLGTDAVSHNFQMTKVTLPESLVTIGDHAFTFCRALKSVTVPAGVRSVGNGAFFCCDAMTSAVICNDTISEREFAACDRLASVTFSDSLREIGTYAFNDCFSLKIVTIPGSVDTIGMYAFAECRGLSSLTLEKGIRVIDMGAFEECKSLKEVTVPDSVTTVGKEAFDMCEALKTVILGKNVASIGGSAFGFCYALEEITIPAATKTIGNSAFAFCNRLSEVFYGGTEAMWREVSIGTYQNEPLTTAIITYANQPVIVARFTDVDPNQYYAEAVDWAVDNGVTSGTSPTTFSPSAPCTRGQVVTFLWRAMGSPAPRASRSSFADVKDSGAYYYKAVLWAAEQGITAGTDTSHFSPGATVTRSQVVTFLWRAAGSPKASGALSFQDVSKTAYYADAVRWAVQNRITTGTGAVTFSPNDPCTRAQIVTFLYRAGTT